MVFYFVTRELVPGSLLQRFVDGDDDFRNSRLKLIPSVPKVLSCCSFIYQDYPYSVVAARINFTLLSIEFY